MTSGGGPRGWATALATRLVDLQDPSREDLFVLLVTWLQANVTPVQTALRRLGTPMALVEPLETTRPTEIMAALSAAPAPAELAGRVVAAARALDRHLAALSPTLLTGEHAGIDGRWFRVRPRIVPGGIDELYGAARDDPTFGVARRMACIPSAALGDVRVVDAPPLRPLTRTRLAMRRERGSLRVLVDAIPPDPSQWEADGSWIAVRRGDAAVLDAATAATMAAAAEREADVVVLPELALGPSSLASLQDQLRRSSRRHPALVVVGVTHEGSGAGPLVVNEAVLLDGDGRELLRHRKLVAFSTMDGSAGLTEERLDPGHSIGVLPTPVGNMAVLICKDLFADRPEAALRLGYVTWLLVPSLSRTTGPHRDRARQLRPRRITTVVCNTWHPEPDRVTHGPHVIGGPTVRPQAASDRRVLFEVPV